MRLTPWTWGCATVAAVLGVIGLFLDSPAATGGAVGLTLLLCVQAVIFLNRTARYADDLHIERVIGEGAVWQGAPVLVGVRVTAPAMPGLRILLTDFPPGSAVYRSEETVLPNGEGRYWIRFAAPGEVFFRGLQIDAADQFFSTTILCSAPRFAGPGLTVYPTVNRGVKAVSGDRAGDMEHNKAGVRRGEGVRSFRPFHVGDDPAMLDWKLTAKYGRPFVREPTTQAGNYPLVVVDLPTGKAPGAGAILSAAGEAIQREMRERGSCSLLLIAGGEVIDYRYHERNLKALVRLLGLQLPNPIHPLYRVMDPIMLRRRLRSTEQGHFAPSQRLAAALRATLAAGEKSAFEVEVDRAMAGSEYQEVVVYTAPADEVSHLNLLASAARRRRRRLVIRLPQPSRASISGLSPYPYVELI